MGQLNVFFTHYNPPLNKYFFRIPFRANNAMKVSTFLRHYQRCIMIIWFKGYLSSTWTQILIFCRSSRISMPFTASE